VTRALLALIVIAGCGGGDTNAGRIEISRDGGTLVIRDTLHVIELPMTKASHGLAFVQLELPAIEFPGRVAFVDEEHGVMLALWITRLGAKRPENIQRWFDEKIGKVSRAGGTIVKDEGTRFGEHPARISDANAPSKDWPKGHYTRVIGIDVPEHDLEILVIGVVDSPTPNLVQQQWLDDLLADMRAIKIAAPAATK
jgi:hypothetical protein